MRKNDTNFPFSNGMEPKLDQVINIYKRRSETPLQVIDRYKALHPELKRERMTYAGRLDPMAEGVLLVLVGEATKRRDDYTVLDKDYEFEFILGVDTDTHDILGKIEATMIGESMKVADSDVEKALMKNKGKFNQSYPAYSSKIVNGVPLFELARKGKIGTVTLPEHEVFVAKMEYLGTRDIKKEDLKKDIEAWICALDGDFRQRDILALWRVFFEKNDVPSFKVYKARVTCGSGFYVRRLVYDIGKELGVGAVTLTILRTRAGGFLLKDSQK